MASYLYAVQDKQGREIVSEHVDVEKVGDVTAYLRHAEAEDDYIAVLTFEDVEIASASANGETDVTLLRWPSDDKLSDPVRHDVPVL